MSTHVEIRLATTEDIPCIARVLVDTWRSTFNGRLPSDFLDEMTYSRQETRHRKTFSKPEAIYYVAVESGAVIGFASGGPTRHSSLPQESELFALYVLASHQGNGIGKKLFVRIAADLEQSGRKGMIVWVLDSNPNRGFYQKLGGLMVANAPIALGSVVVEQIAYAWP